MFRNRMERKFDNIYNQAQKKKNQISFDFKTEKLVCFSDHHKGDSSAADDFRKNAALYDEVLSFYKKEDYKLLVVGDNEELWENRYAEILRSYRSLIKKEIDMSLETLDGEKIRIFGNHDKEVSLGSFGRQIKKEQEHILDCVQYKEGICLGDSIFFIHGHQGRFFDDKAWKISRWAVQFIWKTIQKILRIGSDGPSENYEIRDDMEKKYYKWAKKNKVFLICGHTHRAIFGSLTHFDRIQINLAHLQSELKRAPQEERTNLIRAIQTNQSSVTKILKSRKNKRPEAFETRPIPCYFNSGCCCYTNGMTCLELDRGQIRLIKWQRQDKSRHILAEARMNVLMDYIFHCRPVDEGIEPLLKNIPLDLRSLGQGGTKGGGKRTP